MVDELQQLREEVARLRREVADVRRVVGHDCICLTDREGRPRVSISLNEEGTPQMQVWNKERQVIVSLGEGAEGAGEIFVAGADGRPRAGMKVNGLGGIVSTQNPEGRVNALMLGKDDGGQLLIANSQGQPVAKVAAFDGKAIVQVNEPTGRPVAYMMCDGERGVLSVFNETGDQAASLSSDENGGALVFFDADGKPRVSLPIGTVEPTD